MKNLLDIFGEHKTMLLNALAEEVKARGGVIKLKAIIGGKNALGLDRQTIIDRVCMYKGLFDETEQVFIMAHDKKFPTEKIERPLGEFSLDVVETICWACDEELKKGGNNGK